MASPRSDDGPVHNQTAIPGNFPVRLTDLIDRSLTSQDAKQAATSLAASLNGGNLSIANGNPAVIPGLGP